MTIIGLDRFEQFHQIVEAHENGRLSTVAWGTTQPVSIHPRRAKAGTLRSCGRNGFTGCTVIPATGKSPQNTWTRTPALLVRLCAKHARPKRPRSIQSQSLDTEQTLPNMRQGDLLVGSFANNQIGHNRPFPGAGYYRTPIPGLYLCGGSTHPRRQHHRSLRLQRCQRDRCGRRTAALVESPRHRIAPASFDALQIFTFATGNPSAILSHPLGRIRQPKKHMSAEESSSPVARPWWKPSVPVSVTACVVIGPGSITTSTNVGAADGYSKSRVVVLAVVFMLAYMQMAARLGVADPDLQRRLRRKHAGQLAPPFIGVGIFFIAAPSSLATTSVSMPPSPPMRKATTGFSCSTDWRSPLCSASRISTRHWRRSCPCLSD